MADNEDRDIVLAHQPAVRLGSLLIEPALRRIIAADGREEFVEPRVMQVLVALLQAEGGIVSRDDLVTRCWEGRIVGDDAINRVLSRLRRLAGGIGDGQFTVETITKVGYRLMASGAQSAITRPFVAALESTIPPARRVRTLWLAGASTLLLILGLLLWFRLSDHPPDAPQVRLALFDSLTPRLPVQPNDLRAELLAAFGTDSSLDIITEDKAAGVGRHVYLLGGAIGGDGQHLRFVTFLTDEESGTQIWTSKIERPAEEAATAPRLVAAIASQVVRCTLSGISEQGRGLPVRVVSLYAAYCGELWADESNNDRVIDLARRVTEAAPDFARGWSGLALAEALALRDRSRVDWATMHLEADKAAANAEKLDPHNSESYAAKALLLPIADFGGREAMHRRSTEVEPSDCGCEHQYYAVFLGGVGRLDEAAFEAKRGHDMEPLALISTWRLADMLYSSGRPNDADAIFHQAEALWPDAPLIADLDLRAALAMHDYGRGLARAAKMDGEDGQDARLLFGALKAGVPQQALPRFRARAADAATNSRFVADALGALGDDAAALDAAERLIDRTGGRALLTFEDAALGPARATPGFVAIAKRIGLLGYWHATGKRPDFCRAARAASICGMI